MTNKATPAFPPAKFKPMKAKPHPRDAEIEAAQPPMLTPNGAVGNWPRYGDFMEKKGN